MEWTFERFVNTVRERYLKHPNGYHHLIRCIKVLEHEVGTSDMVAIILPTAKAQYPAVYAFYKSVTAPNDPFLTLMLEYVLVDLLPAEDQDRIRAVTSQRQLPTVSAA